MDSSYSVKLSKLIKEFNLTAVFLPQEPESIEIKTAEVNRPGLNISGFYEYFQPTRIQIIGRMEAAYLKTMSSELRTKRLAGLCEKKVPAIVVTNGNEIFEELIESSKKYGVPLLKTVESTSSFMADLISFLNVELGPRIGMHGVFVEVCGEGVLITGESGVGKSETAMELLKRGHRLVADDEVEIRRVSSKTLIGSAPERIRYFMELRGIGIVNAKNLFGISSVKEKERLDMVVNLKPWDANKSYDRIGLKVDFAKILNVKMPKYSIPIKPGRNLAIIIEIAAINNRQKKMGYNAAKELFSRLGLNNS